MSRQRKNLQEFRKTSSLVAGGTALAGLASLSNPVAAQAGEAAKKFTYDPSKGPTTPGYEFEQSIGNNVYVPRPHKDTDQVIGYDLYDKVTGEYKGGGHHLNPEYVDPSAVISTDPSVLSPDVHQHLLSTKTGMAVAGGALAIGAAYGAIRSHQNNKIKKFELGSEVSGNHFGKDITGHVVGHEIKHSFGIPKGYVKVMNAEDKNIYDMHPKETNLTRTNILGLSESLFFGGQNFQIGDEVVQTKEDPNSIPVAAVYGSDVHGKVIDLGTGEHSHLVHIRDFHTGVTHTINKRYLKKIGSSQINGEQNQMNEEYYDDASESPNLVPLVKSIMSGQPATTQELFKDAMKEKLTQAVDFYKQTQLSGVFNDSPTAVTEGFFGGGKKAELERHHQIGLDALQQAGYKIASQSMSPDDGWKPWNGPDAGTYRGWSSTTVHVLHHPRKKHFITYSVSKPYDDIIHQVTVASGPMEEDRMFEMDAKTPEEMIEKLKRVN